MAFVRLIYVQYVCVLVGEWLFVWVYDFLCLW